MSATPHNNLNLPQRLDNSLILRLATPADVESIAAFNTRVLLDETESSQILDAWTRDLMSGRHPTTSAADFVVVEDSTENKIVCSTCLIPQVWCYEDVPFQVGRPELVGTDPAYRRRGLVRTIFETIHALSTAYGHMVQAITGIPWFYRQFDYEYALPLGGGRNLDVNNIPALKDDEAEPYHIRPATEADIPTVMYLYERQCRGKLVTTLIDEQRWRYDFSGHTPGSDSEIRIFCICDAEAQVVGYYLTPALLWGTRLGLRGIVADEGIALQAVVPSVLRALRVQGEILAQDDEITLTGIRLAFGAWHPLYEILDRNLLPLQGPYAWYVRVADLPGFIGHIRPVLERRLADSIMSSFSGDLKISFYRGGLRLAFEQGKLSKVTDWRAPDTNQSWKGAAFPTLVFLQLLFGYRSLSELRYAFPDCWANDEAAILLDTLFPKCPSWVVPLG